MGRVDAAVDEHHPYCRHPLFWQMGGQEMGVFQYAPFLSRRLRLCPRFVRGRDERMKEGARKGAKRVLINLVGLVYGRYLDLGLGSKFWLGEWGHNLLGSILKR